MDIYHTQYHERFYAECAGCGEVNEKKLMYAIMTRYGSRVPRTVCHLCRNCYINLLEQYGFGE